jgi:hypothetical protein
VNTCICKYETPQQYLFLSNSRIFKPNLPNIYLQKRGVYTPWSDRFTLDRIYYQRTDIQTTYLGLYYPDQQMHNISVSIIFYISLSTPKCFNASASPSGSLNFVLAIVTKLLKLQLNKSSRLKFARDRCCMIKYKICNVNDITHFIYWILIHWRLSR